MTHLLASLWMPDLATMRLVLPELLLVGTLAVLMLAPLVTGRRPRLMGLIALAGCVLAAVAAALTFELVADRGLELFAVGSEQASAAGPAPGMLVVDRFSLFFRLFLMVFLVAVIGMWFWFDAARERYAPEFFTLLIASALGMALMASTINLLLMLICIELASMPSFALAGFDRWRRQSAEAGVKYVVFGAATSGFMVYGVSLLYGMFGTLHVPTLAARIAAASGEGYSAGLLAVALLAVFAGIAFKISAVPFHFWCPDVFEGAPLPITTWLSVASKAAGLVLLLRLVSLFAEPQVPEYANSFLPMLAGGIGFFALLTCTWANLAAYRQTNVRRLLAYSSIAHAGYMLCAGAVVFRGPGIPQALLAAVLAYLLIYMFMNSGAFLSVGLVAADSGREDLEAFTGLGWRDGLTAGALSVCLFSLIGLPPLGGFIVKWWLIWSLGGAASAATVPGLTTLLWILVIGVVLNTVISLFYYVRVIRQMYLRGVEVTGGGLRAPVSGKLALHVCALMLILTGTLLIGPLKRGADRAAEATFSATAPPAAEVAAGER